MHLRNIDLNLLLVLDALLRERSVKRAATRVGLSPSAVSHALSRLRDTLDDDLLVRAGREMVLTPLADDIRPRLDAALSALEHAVSPQRELSVAQLERAFVIAGTDYTEMFPLRYASARLAAAAPGVAVEMRHQRVDRVADLRSGEVDLDIGLAVSGYDDILAEPLLDDTFALVLRRGHPALRRRLTVERFAALDHVLVSPRGGQHGFVDTLLARRSLRRRVSRVVSSFASAAPLVADSDLVATVPRRVALAAAPVLDLVVRDPPLRVPPLTIHQLWHRRSHADAAHRWLRDEIRAAAAALGD